MKNRVPQAKPVLRVVAPGLLATVQDAGRPGMQRFGVPPGGAMDAVALHAANRLVGNPPAAAVLELMSGASFEFLAPTLLAVTGADLGATLDEQPLSLWRAVLARQGARAYLALAGGVDMVNRLSPCSIYSANNRAPCHCQANLIRW